MALAATDEVPPPERLRWSLLQVARDLCDRLLEGVALGVQRIAFADLTPPNKPQLAPPESDPGPEVLFEAADFPAVASGLHFPASSHLSRTTKEETGS